MTTSKETIINEEEALLFEALPPMQNKRVAFAIGRYQPPTGYTGYVYVWYDTKRKMFYVGSHLGSLDDNYLCSSKRCKRAILARPESFRFRVLEYTFENSFQLRQTETKWLQMIRPEELNVKYYNLKRVAFGGNTIEGKTPEELEIFRQNCSIASKKVWAEANHERLEFAKATAFGGNVFSREYMKSEEYRQTMSIATSKELNGFYGKTHSDEVKERWKTTRLGLANNAKWYKLENTTETILIQNLKSYMKKKSIPRIKFERFTNTGLPIKSQKQPNHPFIGYVISTVGKV